MVVYPERREDALKLDVGDPVKAEVLCLSLLFHISSSYSSLVLYLSFLSLFHLMVVHLERRRPDVGWWRRCPPAGGRRTSSGSRGRGWRGRRCPGAGWRSVSRWSTCRPLYRSSANKLIIIDWVIFWTNLLFCCNTVDILYSMISLERRKCRRWIPLYLGRGGR